MSEPTIQIAQSRNDTPPPLQGGAPQVATIERFRLKKTDPLELAEMVKAMRDKGVPRLQIEHQLGLAKSTINNLLRLLHLLPPDIQELIRGGKLALAKGRALAGLQELELSESELHEAMRTLAGQTSDEETCAAFNQRVQAFKAERLGRVHRYRSCQQEADIDRMETQVDRLVRTIATLPAEAGYLAQMAEVLKPLHAAISKLLQLAEAETAEVVQ